MNWLQGTYTEVQRYIRRAERKRGVAARKAALRRRITRLMAELRNVK